MSYKFLYEWQTLMGAFLGAATPISLWFLAEWYQWYKKHKEHLYRLEKFLVYGINNVIDTHQSINDFIDNRLMILINNVDQRTTDNVYSVDIAFFPLLSTHLTNEDFLDVSTGSGYLDNKLLHAFKMLKDFAIAIDDSRQQFIDMTLINRDMSFSKLNAPKIQNETYKRNIQGFINFVKRDLLEKNIKIYMRVLVSARIGLNIFRKIGIIYWRFKFEPHFKYFKNRQDLKKFRDNTYERIDKFLEKDINIEVEKMESFKK